MLNSGYKGFSRSVRSSEAISNHEMPLSLISKDRIKVFLRDAEVEEQHDKAELETLALFPVTLWKIAAKDLGSTSWHHTSSHFNKTEHYSLYSVSAHLLENLDRLKQEFEAKKQGSKQEKELFFGWLLVEVWGGTRNRPKYLGTEELGGIIDGDWLYHAGGKNNIYANKVKQKAEYATYSDLVKAHPNFKGKVKEFNEIRKGRI